MAKVKVAEFKKPQGLKRLPGLGKTVKAKPLPDLDDGPERVENLVDTELTRLTDALGDGRLAKKLLKLKKQFPDATMLELAIMEFLDRKQVRYEFQKWLLGGRKIRGGQVTDFTVDMGTYVIIIEAQGSYWHNRPGSHANDEAQKFALLGLSVWGKKIKKVIAVWEQRIMQPNKTKREQTLQLALSGIEVGQ
jgi:hypothetical protein